MSSIVSWHSSPSTASSRRAADRMRTAKAASSTAAGRWRMTSRWTKPGTAGRSSVGRTRSFSAPPAAVGKLRAEPGGEIRVWGSTELIRTLAGHDLIDEYRLVYPLVLGTSKKLFSGGVPPTKLALVDTRSLPSEW